MVFGFFWGFRRRSPPIAVGWSLLPVRREKGPDSSLLGVMMNFDEFVGFSSKFVLWLPCRL
jgi:hypothetical protein